MNEKYLKLRTELTPINTQIGIIVQFSQQLELGIKYAIALLAETNSFDESDSKFDEEYDAFSKFTLGRLVGKLKECMENSDHAVSVLEDAVKKRNYIIHELFSDNAEALATPEGRKEVLEYIAEARIILFDANMAIHSIIPKLMKLNGLDPEKAHTDTYDAIR
ncbi:hypothetical protein [Saccharophagus degradans]|uniref:Uncharacterized protein n=1 Tax=Saccharophagus degradans TaxID=86304 RepID=A0AAW7X8I5_9GAMM|nr:hypothetical protein [Saccharophagus degradans]MDO6422803.1 hypothetical protein [Saccharophagus degradans]MDO6606276.1 hypothetical protein [Saccharophagus degradans]